MPETSPLRERLSWIRSIFFFDVLIYIYTITFGTLSLLSSIFDGNGRIQHGFARIWSWTILKTIGAPIRMIGGENLDKNRPAVYAANHSSALDIPMLFANMPFQFRIIAKKELFRYPFLGWHLSRSGQIPVEQTDARSSLRALNRASDTVHSGMPLVVFPEGGRTDNGEIKPFMGGAFYVAIRGRVPVIPCAIVGAYEVLRMNSFHIRPQPMAFVIGKPISTEGYGVRDMDALAERTKSAIEDLYYAYSKVPDPRKASDSPKGPTPVAPQFVESDPLP